MKRILPPTLFSAALVLIVLFSFLPGSSGLITGPFRLLGLPVSAGGLILSIYGKKLFRKLGTNVMTFSDPDVLVDQGIYHFSRNPMYLGFLIALAGVVVLCGASLSAIVVLILFFVVTDRWYIAFEEQAMQSRFGSAYSDYCKRVRRWI